MDKIHLLRRATSGWNYLSPISAILRMSKLFFQPVLDICLLIKRDEPLIRPSPPDSTPLSKNPASLAFTTYLHSATSLPILKHVPLQSTRHLVRRISFTNIPISPIPTTYLHKYPSGQHHEAPSSSRLQFSPTQFSKLPKSRFIHQFEVP